MQCRVDTTAGVVADSGAVKAVAAVKRETPAVVGVRGRAESADAGASFVALAAAAVVAVAVAAVAGGAAQGQANPANHQVNNRKPVFNGAVSPPSHTHTLTHSHTLVHTHSHTHSHTHKVIEERT